MKRWWTLGSIRTEVDPEPRVPDAPPARLEWPISAKYRCPPIIPPLPQCFNNVVESRRSQRLILPASLRELANAVGYTLAPRFENEWGRFRGLTASAGALQAVDVLLVFGDKIFRYDRALRSILRLRVKDRDRLTRFISRCQAVLPDAHGAFAIFVGDLAYISGYYERPETLLFRDAGALHQTMAFAFTAYRLAFCPMGLLGVEIVEAVGLDPDKAVPLAAAAMGRQPAVNFQKAIES